MDYSPSLSWIVFFIDTILSDRKADNVMVFPCKFTKIWILFDDSVDPLDGMRVEVSNRLHPCELEIGILNLKKKSKLNNPPVLEK